MIFSHHDFRTTPSLSRLSQLARRARKAGCTVFKVATTAAHAEALTVLMRFLTETPGFARAETACPTQLPGLAVMGMGPFGKISRLTLGRAGSVLNYGYLDTIQVPGQWPAALLKERLLELI